MPLEYSDLWGGKEFRDLADLPLPGPALVIDVRHSVEDKGRLIWYLAIEVEDLAREMRLNKVRHWRHLAECIDFLKIDASLPDPTQDKATEFMITTRVGDGVRQGQSDLAHYIGREHIDRV